MVHQHILAILSNMSSTKPIMTFTQARFESSGFLPLGTPKYPCVCSSCWQWRGTSSHCGCLSDYLQIPWHHCRDVVVNDVLRWALNLTEDTLPLIINVCINNSQIKCFWTHDMEICIILVCGSCAQSLYAPFSHNLWVHHMWHGSI
jgi:hypothetical protein